MFSRLNYCFFASAAYAAMETYFCLVRCGFCPARSVFLSLRKYTERISMKFMKFRGCNHYHEQIKLLHLGRHWNRDNEVGYDRIFESTTIGVTAMSNKCWRPANEFTNFECTD